ncbi:MAG: undecaprenyl-diphosphate phosphatase, partial [Planctomycetota bacterium]
VAIALMIGGAVLILIERVGHRDSIATVHDIDFKHALAIGLFQCLAMFPGTSRSAATIIGAMILGASRPAAAEFSFFLAIPTMYAAGIYSLLKHLDQIQSTQLLTLAVGFAVAFIVAWVVVAAFMRFIQTHKFTSFAIYRIIIGAIVLFVILRPL